MLCCWEWKMVQLQQRRAAVPHQVTHGITVWQQLHSRYAPPLKLSPAVQIRTCTQMFIAAVSPKSGRGKLPELSISEWMVKKHVLRLPQEGVKPWYTLQHDPWKHASERRHEGPQVVQFCLCKSRRNKSEETGSRLVVARSWVEGIVQGTGFPSGWWTSSTTT